MKKGKKQLVQSSDSETVTLTCPKCKAVWRAKGHYNYDLGGWTYYDEETSTDDGICPCGCKNFFGNRIKGTVS